MAEIAATLYLSIATVKTHVGRLFDKLGATEEQLDFPVIYASAKEGYAKKEMKDESSTMVPLFG